MEDTSLDTLIAVLKKEGSMASSDLMNRIALIKEHGSVVIAGFTKKLEDIKAQFKSEIDSMTGQQTILRESVKALTIEATEAKDRKTRESAELDRDIEKKKIFCSDLDTRANSLETEIKTLIPERDGLRDVVLTFRVEESGLTRTVNKLKEDEKIKTASVAKLTDQEASLTTSVEGLRKEVARLTGDVGVLEARIKNNGS